MACRKDESMSAKIFGAILVIVGCGSVGFRLASSQKKEEALIRQLVSTLDYMECEMQYRLTPLPELCKLASDCLSGQLRSFFVSLSEELEAQVSPDVPHCVRAALSKSNEYPPSIRELLTLLGKTLGKFDVEGQLKGFEEVRSEGRRKLEEMAKNRDIRLRSYQTLGLCAGAAMAILFA